VASIAVDASLCLLYILLNAALNFSNRMVLGVSGFRFPLTLTTGHMLLNPLFLSPLMFLLTSYRKQHRDIISERAKALAIVAVCNGVQIALNNSSLVHIELSTNQVMRASMPVVVALVETTQRKVPSLRQLCMLSLISAGVALVVYEPGGSESEWFGVMLVAGSVLLQAAQMVFAGGLLAGKLDSFQITFYTSPPACATLLFPAIIVEGSTFRSYAVARPDWTAGVVFGTCALAVLYNVVMFQTIKRLSAVGSAVLGNVKIVTLLLFSRFMGEMQLWTLRQFFGCALTFGSAMMYSALKLRAGPVTLKKAAAS